MRARGGWRAAGGKDAGLTLIELVVAMAIFALVSVMGLQAITGLVRQQQRVLENELRTAALSRAAALLRNDISAMVPITFRPPSGAGRRSATEDGPGWLAVSATTPSLRGTRPGQAVAVLPDMARVVWRHDPGTGSLTRQAWSGLSPASESALQPARTVLDNVSGLRARSYWSGFGWIDGIMPPDVLRFAGRNGPGEDRDGGGGRQESYSDLLPLAVEVIIETGDLGAIPIMKSLR